VMASDRATLQQLAACRLEEAKLLMREEHFSGAYYIAGYAIEFALKARIAAQFRADEIPDKDLVNAVYRHDLAKLLGLAGLETALKDACRSDSGLDRRWSIVKNWNEQARYSLWTEDQAAAMIDAIDGSSSSEGVFQWLNARW
jgi:hypothetical protein